MAPPGNHHYPGIFNDRYGGMTDTGKIIREAWVFGILPEDETCEGWPMTRIERLWEQVQDEWARYGFQVLALPPELRERFERIQTEALERARAAGWNPDEYLNDDD